MKVVFVLMHDIRAVKNTPQQKPARREPALAPSSKKPPPGPVVTAFDFLRFA
jgi:hypothetical protein